MGWLVEAEAQMPDIFTSGSTGTDSQALEEIRHFVELADRGDGVREQLIINFARKRVPTHTVLRVIEILVASGMILPRGQDRFGHRWFRSVKSLGEGEGAALN